MKVAVVVNKDDGALGASETFLHAHIDRLPCRVIPIIGNPGYRRLGKVGGAYIVSQSMLSRGVRWLQRCIGLATPSQQDSKTLVAFFQNEGIQAVLAEYGPTAVTVMDACREACIPLIAHFHGYDSYRESLLSEYREEYQRLFREAAAVIAVSTHMRSQLLSLGGRPESLFYNSCGADIPARLVADPAASSPVFLMVGRLVDKKAPQISIRAFFQVLAHCPDARLEIIGDGPLRTACEQLCGELGISSRVHFAGPRPHQEVLQAMSCARAFVQHSVRAPDGDMEGTPVGVLEAMGLGLPVIATRHGGIMDVIKSGDNGLLVDEHDVATMARHMIEMALVPQRAGALGRAARSTVLANWTTSQSVERLWRIIEGVLPQIGHSTNKRGSA